VDVPSRQAMRGPGDGVRLAGAGRLLDQVALDDAHFARRRDDLGQGSADTSWTAADSR